MLTNYCSIAEGAVIGSGQGRFWHGEGCSDVGGVIERERSRERERRETAKNEEEGLRKGLECTTPLKVLRGPFSLLSFFFFNQNF